MFMQCREGCGACCIAPSIKSPIPSMPAGKPAGMRCIQLDKNNACKIFSQPQRPVICAQFKAEVDICGTNREEALLNISELEEITAVKTH